MFAALAARGHSVALVLRSYLAPLAPLVAPGAAVFPFSGNPYSPEFADTMQHELTPSVDGLRSWKPDAIVVGPFQRTVLDEHIVERLSPLPALGMAGILYPGAIEYGLNQASKINLTRQVTVREEAPELSKHEALCGMLIGESISLPKPALEIPEPVSSNAIRWLARRGLLRGAFWAVCAGHNRSTRIRNWLPSGWAQAASTLVDEFGMSLLFIGTPDENEAVTEILALMGGGAAHCVNTCNAPPALDLLPGILDQSRGYLGKDTGPMHIAAALQKPVIAVFGGGTWPRCIPAADSGAAVTCAVPCSGCGWNCHFDESHCVKDVPVELVIQSLRSAVAGSERFRTIMVEPDIMKLKEMGREAATVARARLRRLNGELTRVRAAAQASQAEVNGLHEIIRDLQQQLRQESAHVGEQLRQANRLVEQKSLEAADLRDLLESIRRSVFTRVLVALRIWRVFRPERRRP
ncbi:MAG: glycosyltransferase family 9 protein [Bryobacteraceae bacterium]